MDNVKWPNIPEITSDDPQADVKKSLYEAKLEIVKAGQLAIIERETHRIQNEKESQVANDFELVKNQWAHEYELDKEVQSAYIDIAKGQIERSIKRAEYVQAAASAIMALYTGILALTFSIGSSPLPARGMAPAFFLGLAIVFSAAYVSFIEDAGKIKGPSPTGLLYERQKTRRNTFIKWTKIIVLQRSNYLRLSVIHLGLGVLFLPAPYLGLNGFIVFSLVIVGLILSYIFAIKLPDN